MAKTGMPTVKAAILPQAAHYLMRNEDKGMEEDQDPTDGGQGGASAEADKASSGDPVQVPPELLAAVKQLVDHYGSDIVEAACSQASQDQVAQDDDSRLQDDSQPDMSDQQPYA